LFFNNNFQNFTASTIPALPQGMAIEVSNQLNGVVQITNNTINTASGASSEINTGILVSSAQQSNAQVNVQNNTIHRAANGITLRNQVGASVLTNTIRYFKTNAQVGVGGSFLIPNHAGVRVSNCSGALVRENVVQRNAGWLPNQNVPVGEFHKLAGVFVDFCDNCNIIDNRAQKLLAGIYVRGLNPSTLLQCNRMQQNKDGIYFNNATINPDQMPNGTAQGNRFTNNERFKLGGNFALSQGTVNWYWGGGSNQFNPNPYEPTLDPIFNEVFPPQTFNPDCPSFVLPFAGPLRDFATGAVVRNENQYGIMPQENRDWERYYAYRYLRSDTSLLNLGLADDSDYIGFYQTEDATPVKHICMFDEAIRNQDTLTAYACNNQLGSTHAYDVYQREVNDIYLATWHVGVFDLDSNQTATLEYIACQEPIEYGPAVFAAQALLRDNFVCGNVNRTQSAGNNHHVLPKAEPKIYLYPNPAQQQVSVAGYTGEGAAQWLLMDLTGKLVYTAPVNGHVEVINLPNLSPGMYIWQLNVNGVLLQLGKLEVQR
jgi:hypothetical protein